MRRANTRNPATTVPPRAATSRDSAPNARVETPRLEMPRFSVSQAPAANREPSVSTAIESPGDLRLLEAVADTVERLDHVEAVVGLLELLAQALDVAVDGAVVDIDLVVVGRIHQGIAALHHAGALSQGVQDQELGDGEHHLLALPGAGVALRVHAQQPAVQDLGVG